MEYSTHEKDTALLNVLECLGMQGAVEAAYGVRLGEWEKSPHPKPPFEIEYKWKSVREIAEYAMKSQLWTIEQMLNVKVE